MTQKERQERSRREILRAAREEFGSHDYGQVTMESICSGHGISKGMMYHYYANKDELFLLCVQDTFLSLRAYVEREAEKLAGQKNFDAIKKYFMIREYFFQLEPKHKRVFENAMLRPPEQLREQIQILHRPLEEMNRRFLRVVVSGMRRRPELKEEQVNRYLESIVYTFSDMLLRGRTLDDIHAMLEATEELLDMILFGVFQQADAPSREQKTEQ